MTILATGPLDGFFTEVVGDAMKARGVEATGGATSYLIGMLADFARLDGRTEETMERPLAFLLDEALHAAQPAERFEKLRSLGDGVLYSCGFFADHFEARGVEQSYLVGIGTTAYGAASSMLRAPTKEDALDVFAELAAKFGDFASVLADVADSTIAKGASSSKSLLKLYERWLKTGSDRLARTLGEQGLVPTRGPKGMQ
jgi:hypothetical protein